MGRGVLKEKAPAVQWYPKQALGDDKILAMDWDARGMHWWLLNLSWQQEPPGTIPDDDAVIRRWLGSPSDDVWRRVRPQIMTAWPVQDDRRANAGMVRAAERQRAFSESRTVSARARWDAYAMRDEIRKPCESTKEEVEVGFILPAWVPKKAWKDYLDMRQRIRKAMTDRAKELAVRELQRLVGLGESAEKILEQSVMNSWQGLFPIQVSRNGAKPAKSKLQESFDVLDKIEF